MNVARQAIKRGGYRALWRGFLTNQTGVIPAHSVYVTGLEWSKQHITRAANNWGCKPGTSSHIGSFIGGATASFCAQLVRTPTDIIAQRLMIQGSKGSQTTYQNGLHAFQTIVKTEGFRGLYAGLGAAVLVSVPFSALFWSSYTTLKSHIGHSMTHAAAFSAQVFGREEEIDIEVTQTAYFRPPFGIWEAVVFSSSAFISSCVALAVTNPIDVVKTRIQTKAKTGRTAEGGRLAQSGAGIIQHLISIVKFEGW
eukprot:CAMPEP_0167784518 /NCGR_PEP_ID=MMETSP0111_2-20121227/7681_1 /TAXON_ID=91324 /ORGANISM="Lotharella globosa, Strain CCCM811" /LENGTH=252 /DNA_ID=CAMNT_0007675597 /DNA_START=175 /DNA_END=930 /DNA_ORIENTATION=-